MSVPSHRTVLVTGIGGDVGQGILRNIRAAFPDIRLVGTDVGALPAGIHFCDAAYTVPYSHDASYYDRMLEICAKEKVELIIPSTDYEVTHLGKIETRLPALLASPHEVSEIFMDKYRTFQEFKRCGIAFADTRLATEYADDWPHIVVKPRDGRGSRDVSFDPAEIPMSENFIVQPLIEGRELTIAFYVTKEGQLHGFISFERELKHGHTDRCEVVTIYDNKIRALIEQLIKHFTIRGPCNIQAKLTADGELIPFEINCRYSGTNSIRAKFGFEDVRYGIEEYLLHTAPTAPAIKPGSAVRIMMDIIFEGASLAAASADASGKAAQKKIKSSLS